MAIMKPLVITGGNFQRLQATDSISGVAKGIYGDGSDGDVVIASGTTTLTRSMYYDDLTIDAGAVLDTDGFIAYVKGTLTINGTYRRNGVSATGVTGGVAPSAARPIDTSDSGGAGGAGGGNGTNPGAVAFVPLGYTTTGGAGGSSSTRTGGAGGTSTVQAASTGSIRNSILMSMMAFAARGAAGFDFVRSGPGGGGGAGSATQAGGGGGSGCPPNLIIANAVVNNGVIESKGGNGFSAVNTDAAGGGGGGGGLVCIITESYTGSGTVDLSGGTGGNGNGIGTAGAAGGTGLQLGPIPG